MAAYSKAARGVSGLAPDLSLQLQPKESAGSDPEATTLPVSIGGAPAGSTGSKDSPPTTIS